MSLYSSKIWRSSTGHVETFEDGADLVFEAGSHLAMPVQTVSSTATVLKNFGVSIVKTTVSSSAKRTNVMTAPSRPGLLKIINFSIKNTTKGTFIDLSTGVTVVAQTTETAARYLRYIPIAAKETFATLVSLTTAKWLALAKTTNISLTTSSTAA
jgi:hypothetical protein